MFFVLPIGHESDKVRRLPWISFIIMAACLIIHILVSVEISKTAKELESDAKELVNYYLKHPYLKLDPETKKLLFGEKNNELHLLSLSSGLLSFMIFIAFIHEINGVIGMSIVSICFIGFLFYIRRRLILNSSTS